MKIDDEVAGLLETCATLDQLKEGIRQALRAHHTEDSPRMVNTLIKGLMGGTIARLDESGQPLNPWRRKFLHQNQEATQPEPLREAA